MKRFLLATVATMALAMPSMAADLPVKAPVQPVANPADLFSGWWVGAELGGATGTVNPDLTGVANLSPSGFIGGGSITYRSKVQPGWYFGMSTDLDFADLTNTITPAKGVTASAKTGWLGRTTLQAGYTVIPQMLVYLDGGLAYGSTKGSVTCAAGTCGKNGLAFSDTERAVGYTLGAGFDYSLAQFTNIPGLTAGFEYAYVDLGKSNACFNIFAGVCVGTHYTNTENLFLGNVKWRFGS